MSTGLSATTGVQASERNQEATLWLGGLEAQVTEELLYELFVNAGPVTSVSIPKDKITAQSSNFAFVEFASPSDADYALRVLSSVRLFGKPLRLNRAAKDRQGDEEYHAKLFVGNLDAEVDEKTLYDTFAQFGPVLSAKVMTEPESDVSRGFGFITFDSFRSADEAIEAMNGQYLSNRPLHVSYAFKQGSKGERHGSDAERELERRSRARRGLTDVRPLTRPPPAMPTQLPPMPAGMMMGMMPPPPIPSAFPMAYGAYPPPPPPIPGSYPGFHPSRLPPMAQMPPIPPPPMPPGYGVYGMMPPPPPPVPSAAPVYLSYDHPIPPAPMPPPPMPSQS